MRLISLLMFASAFLLTTTSAAAEPATKNETASRLLRTVMTSPAGGIAQIGGRVNISCKVIRQADVIMVKLLKLSLSPGADGSEEVFTAGGGKHKLRSPWNARPDLSFDGSKLAIAFNMSQSDEGRFRCDAVTLDGQLPGNELQLMTLQPPSAPGLLFDGASTDSAHRLEAVIGDNLTVNCSANVGKPAGDLRLTFAPAGKDSGQELDIPGVSNASWTGLVSGANSTSMTSIFKSALATVKVDERHQAGQFVCRLTPSPMAVKANGNGTSAGNSTSAQKFVARGPIVWALFPVSFAQ